MKPVRDIVLQTLQYWNNIQGPDTPEPSEAGSSIKGLLINSRYQYFCTTAKTLYILVPALFPGILVEICPQLKLTTFHGLCFLPLSLSH